MPGGTGDAPAMSGGMPLSERPSGGFGGFLQPACNHGPDENNSEGPSLARGARASLVPVATHLQSDVDAELAALTTSCATPLFELSGVELSPRLLENCSTGPPLAN